MQEQSDSGVFVLEWCKLLSRMQNWMRKAALRILKNRREQLSRFVKRFLPQKAEVLLEEYLTNLKNYYAILQVDANAKPPAIKAAYKRLTHVFHSSLSEATRESRFFSQIIKDTDEAYRVLSNRSRRLAYDNLFKARYDTLDVETDSEIINEIIRLSELAAKDVPEKERHGIYKILDWTGDLRRAFLIGITSFILVLTVGTSFALAEPEHAVARPFRGPAVVALKASSGTIGLINDVRGVVAGYERNIVQTSVQSMRVMENLSSVPTVTVPTNDMACFPSERYSLFPEFLDKRYSQFRYTSDKDGIVKVYTSTATTDEFLTKIERLISQLEEE